MREQEMQGNISINEYQEIDSGYSVFESTKDFLTQWAKDNAQENAQIKEQEPERVAKICRVKVCKNGNLFIGCYDESITKYVNFFVSPAVALTLCPSGIVQAVYTVTPQGRKVRTGWEWVDSEALAGRFKDLQVVYSNNVILEVF